MKSDDTKVPHQDPFSSQKLFDAAIFLLQCVEFIDCKDLKKCLSYNFKEAKSYFSKVSLKELQIVLQASPIFEINDGSKVSLNDANSNILISAINDREKLLLIITLIFVYNNKKKIHFSKLVQTVNKCAPTGINVLESFSASEQFHYFKGNSEYFEIENSGYVSLKTDCDIEALAETENSRNDKVKINDDIVSNNMKDVDSNLTSVNTGNVSNSSEELKINNEMVFDNIKDVDFNLTCVNTDNVSNSSGEFESNDNIETNTEIVPDNMEDADLNFRGIISDHSSNSSGECESKIQLKEKIASSFLYLLNHFNILPQKTLIHAVIHVFEEKNNTDHEFNMDYCLCILKKLCPGISFDTQGFVKLGTSHSVNSNFQLQEEEKISLIATYVVLLNKKVNYDKVLCALNEDVNDSLLKLSAASLRNFFEKSKLFSIDVNGLVTLSVKNEVKEKKCPNNHQSNCSEKTENVEFPIANQNYNEKTSNVEGDKTECVVNFFCERLETCGPTHYQKLQNILHSSENSFREYFSYFSVGQLINFFMEKSQYFNVDSAGIVSLNSIAYLNPQLLPLAGVQNDSKEAAKQISLGSSRSSEAGASVHCMQHEVRGNIKNSPPQIEECILIKNTNNPKDDVLKDEKNKNYDVNVHENKKVFPASLSANNEQNETEFGGSSASLLTSNCNLIENKVEKSEKFSFNASFNMTNISNDDERLPESDIITFLKNKLIKVSKIDFKELFQLLVKLESSKGWNSLSMYSVSEMRNFFLSRDHFFSIEGDYVSLKNRWEIIALLRKKLLKVQKQQLMAFFQSISNHEKSINGVIFSTFTKSQNYRFLFSAKDYFHWKEGQVSLIKLPPSSLTEVQSMEFIREELSKESRIHFTTLFRRLAKHERSRGGETLSVFTVFEMCRFFSSRKNYFSIEKGYVSLKQVLSENGMINFFQTELHSESKIHFKKLFHKLVDHVKSKKETLFPHCDSSSENDLEEHFFCFSVEKMLKFFKNNPQYFSVDSAGLVTLSAVRKLSSLQMEERILNKNSVTVKDIIQNEQNQNEDVVNFFVEVLKNFKSVHYEQLLGYLVSSGNEISSFFKTYTKEKMRDFFLQHPLCFDVSANGGVSLKMERAMEREEQSVLKEQQKTHNAIMINFLENIASESDEVVNQKNALMMESTSSLSNIIHAPNIETKSIEFFLLIFLISDKNMLSKVRLKRYMSVSPLDVSDFFKNKYSDEKFLLFFSENSDYFTVIKEDVSLSAVAIEKIKTRSLLFYPKRRSYGKECSGSANNSVNKSNVGKDSDLQCITNTAEIEVKTSHFFVEQLKKCSKKKRFDKIVSYLNIAPDDIQNYARSHFLDSLNFMADFFAKFPKSFEVKNEYVILRELNKSNPTFEAVKPVPHNKVIQSLNSMQENNYDRNSAQVADDNMRQETQDDTGSSSPRNGVKNMQSSTEGNDKSPSPRMDDSNMPSTTKGNGKSPSPIIDDSNKQSTTKGDDEGPSPMMDDNNMQSTTKGNDEGSSLMVDDNNRQSTTKGNDEGSSSMMDYNKVPSKTKVNDKSLSHVMDDNSVSSTTKVHTKGNDEGSSPMMDDNNMQSTTNGNDKSPSHMMDDNNTQSRTKGKDKGSPPMMDVNNMQSTTKGNDEGSSSMMDDNNAPSKIKGNDKSPSHMMDDNNMSSTTKEDYLSPSPMGDIYRQSKTTCDKSSPSLLDDSNIRNQCTSDNCDPSLALEDNNMQHKTENNDELDFPVLGYNNKQNETQSGSSDLSLVPTDNTQNKTDGDESGLLCVLGDENMQNKNECHNSSPLPILGDCKMQNKTDDKEIFQVLSDYKMQHKTECDNSSLSPVLGNNEKQNNINGSDRQDCFVSHDINIQTGTQDDHGDSSSILSNNIQNKTERDNFGSFSVLDDNSIGNKTNDKWQYPVLGDKHIQSKTEEHERTLRQVVRNNNVEVRTEVDDDDSGPSALVAEKNEQHKNENDISCRKDEGIDLPNMFYIFVYVLLMYGCMLCDCVKWFGSAIFSCFSEFKLSRFYVQPPLKINVSTQTDVYAETENQTLLMKPRKWNTFPQFQRQYSDDIDNSYYDGTYELKSIFAHRDQNMAVDSSAPPKKWNSIQHCFNESNEPNRNDSERMVELNLSSNCNDSLEDENVNIVHELLEIFSDEELPTICDSLRFRSISPHIRKNRISSCAHSCCNHSDSGISLTIPAKSGFKRNAPNGQGKHIKKNKSNCKRICSSRGAEWEKNRFWTDGEVCSPEYQFSRHKHAKSPNNHNCPIPTSSPKPTLASVESKETEILCSHLPEGSKKQILVSSLSRLYSEVALSIECLKSFDSNTVSEQEVNIANSSHLYQTTDSSQLGFGECVRQSHGQKIDSLKTNESQSTQLLYNKPDDDLDKKAVKFFQFILKKHKGTLSIDALQKHLRLASQDVQSYLSACYNIDLAEFFENHSTLFNIDPSRIVKLVNECDESL